MRMCLDHWQKLRDGVAARGLSHLVHCSAEAAAQSLVRQLDGDQSASNFDPLLGANFALFSAFLKDAGLAALNCDHCPLCVVGKQSKELADEWLNGSLDDQLEQARSLGLVPLVS